MANLIGAKIPDQQVPARIGMLTTVFHQFKPSDLGVSAGTLSLGDTIELFTLPKGARITYATVSTTGTLTSSGTPNLTLTLTLSATTSNLTASFTVSTGAAAALMNSAATIKDGTNSGLVRLAIGIGSLDRTISNQTIYTMVQYENDDS